MDYIMCTIILNFTPQKWFISPIRLFKKCMASYKMDGEVNSGDYCIRKEYLYIPMIHYIYTCSHLDHQS